jgi:hypothetical protein
VVETAVTRIETVLPVDASKRLADGTFEIADLPGDLLGMTRGQTIKLDTDSVRKSQGPASITSLEHRRAARNLRRSPPTGVSNRTSLLTQVTSTGVAEFHGRTNISLCG